MAESLASNVFPERCFVMITGASQGLGRSMAVAFAAAVGQGSALALTARNEDGLKETSNLVQKARAQLGGESDIQVTTVPADLTDQQQCLTLVDSCVSGFRSEDYDTAILIHNAGSLGDISKEICDFDDYAKVNDSLNLNIAHLWPTTAKFLKWRLLENPDAKTIIVNVSTLLAILPMPCFSQYCTTKAARDMFFMVLAKENPKLRILSYAPGPLHTAMSQIILSTPNKHNTDKNAKTWPFITSERSAQKLLDLLRKDQYESGAHVDFND